jgi:hypothetical protein
MKSAFAILRQPRVSKIGLLPLQHKKARKTNGNKNAEEQWI